MKTRSLFAALALIAGGAWAGICGEAGTPDETAAHRVLLNVPFFPQSTDQCGPSALASVLNFWGDRTDPQALKNEVYRKPLNGTVPVDILLASQEHGMSAEVITGSLDRLKAELDEGHPIIVMIDVGFSFYPIGHYLVITGYDDQRHGVYAHSGKTENQFWPYNKFNATWEKTDRWTLLMTPLSRV